MEGNTTQQSDKMDPVVYKFRDINKKMVQCWDSTFSKYKGQGIEVSCGDIFQGGPEVDAIVSPANGFGFMDGGIDMVFSRHFGWQMQKRLQKLLKEEYHGELMVGNAVIIPAYEADNPPKPEDIKGCNGEKPIKWLISAPTMRVPLDVSDTANAYLAFRGIIIAVQKHNQDPTKEPIKSVLCPGLGTAVGSMDPQICATQMLNAYESFALGLESAAFRAGPARLIKMRKDHHGMVNSVNFRAYYPGFIGVPREVGNLCCMTTMDKLKVEKINVKEIEKRYC
ncbi:hypothetical protein FSP39_002545 [Pinctada imbricata]|uniref:Macro domain-containing protein n=1 Tax=Pinctada imbricata TaxID=66713 RepID=A0AA88Y326_PINIB|nr:hypothetical protein FSP39_002545 [Pinctada imbricata]